ncbi:ANTAR domain-containing protein [Knoellia sp. CPCC 206435]|uniref:ANTAR domain-containing protein n=1 Tax=Knoellia terrae TaxID=3404797 RepID=UPI003B433A78
MGADRPNGNAGVQGQIDDLRSRVEESEQRADVSESRADKAELRADDSAVRADAAESQTDAGDGRAEQDRRRITAVEERLGVHDELIAELQAEGLISSQHAVQLEAALQTARTIGAAVGIVMAHFRVGEAAAFALLRKASMDRNQKLRLMAEDVVLTGDVSGLPHPPERSA